MLLVIRNNIAIKRIKPRNTSYMVRDNKGLYLRIAPTGRKYWILHYWENGKEHKLSLAPYPDLSLKDVRSKRDEIQTARAKGESLLSRRRSLPLLFSDVCAEWLKVQMSDKAESYVRTVLLRLNRYIPPEIGAIPLGKNTSADVLRI